MRTAPARSDLGQAMLIVLGVVVVMAVLPAVLYSTVSGQLPIATKAQWSQQALQAAQTGLADYTQLLNADATITTACSPQFCGGAGANPGSWPPNPADPGFVPSQYQPSTGSGTNQWEFVDTDAASDSAGGDALAVASGSNPAAADADHDNDNNGESFQYVVDNAKYDAPSVAASCPAPSTSGKVAAISYVAYVTGRAGVNGHYSYRTIKACLATTGVAPYAYGTRYEVLNPGAQDSGTAGEIADLANAIAWARCNILGTPTLFNLWSPPNPSQAVWCGIGTSYAGYSGQWYSAPSNPWLLCNLHQYDHTSNTDPGSDGDGNDAAAGGGDHDADDYNYNVMAGTPDTALGPALGCATNRFFSYRSSPGRGVVNPVNGNHADLVTGPVYTNDVLQVCGTPAFGTPSDSDGDEVAGGTPDNDGDDTVVSAGKTGTAPPIAPSVEPYGCNAPGNSLTSANGDLPTFNGSPYGGFWDPGAGLGSAAPASPVTGAASYAPYNPLPAIQQSAGACTFLGPTSFRFHATNTVVDANGASVSAPSVTVFSPGSTGVTCAGVSFAQQVPHTISLAILQASNGGVLYVKNATAASGCAWNWNYFIPQEGQDAGLAPCQAGDAIVGTPQCTKTYPSASGQMTRGQSGGMPPLCSQNDAVQTGYNPSIQSVLNGKLTIGAENDVWITSSITYDTNGGYCTGSALYWTTKNPPPAGMVYCPSMLALAAGNNVQINHPVSFGAFACGFSAASGCNDTNTNVTDDESGDATGSSQWGESDENATSPDAQLESEAWNDYQCDGAGNPGLNPSCTFGTDALADDTGILNTDVIDPGKWTDNACDLDGQPSSQGCTEPDGDEPPTEPPVTWNDDACDVGGQPALQGCDTSTDGLADGTGIANSDVTDPYHWSDNACDAAGNPNNGTCNGNEPPGSQDGDGEYQIWTGEPGVNWDDNACDMAGNPLFAGCDTGTDGLVDGTDGNDGEGGCSWGVGDSCTDLVSGENSDAGSARWTDNSCDAAGNPNNGACNTNEGPGSQDGDEYQIWTGEPGVNWDDNACDAAGNPGGLLGPCYPDVPGTEAFSDVTSTGNSDTSENITWNDNTCDAAGSPSSEGCAAENDGDEPGKEITPIWSDNACDNNTTGANTVLGACSTDWDNDGDNAILDTDLDGNDASLEPTADVTGTGNSDATETPVNALDNDNDGDSINNDTDGDSSYTGSGASNNEDGYCDGGGNPISQGCPSEPDGDDASVNGDPAPNWCSDNLLDAYAQYNGKDGITFASPPSLTNAITCGGVKYTSLSQLLAEPDADNTEPSMVDHDSDGDSATSDTDSDASSADLSDNTCDAAQQYGQPVPSGCTGESDGDESSGAEPSVNWTDNACDAAGNPASDGDGDGDGTANDTDNDKSANTNTYDFGCKGEPDGDDPVAPANGFTWSDSACDSVTSWGTYSDPCPSEPDGDDSSPGAASECNWLNLLTWGDCFQDAGDYLSVADWGDGSPPTGGAAPWWASIIPLQDAANAETPFPSMDQNLTVDAAIFAPNGSFDLAKYRFGNSGMGTLSVNGAINQDYAGAVGLSYYMFNYCTNFSGFAAFLNFCAGLAPGTSALITAGPTGYAKNYVYDARLHSVVPPGLAPPSVAVSWQQLLAGQS